MSLIACPQCKRKMSSNAVFCSRCGYVEGEVSEDTRLVMQSRMLRERIYRLNMFSYAVITVFLIGFGWFWWNTGGFQHRPSGEPMILMGVTAIAYLVVRVFLFRARQKQKTVRKALARRN